ncbi:DNA repair protein RecO [Lapillicoccus sp.]|uniref:DNA repair protein RecO n=1 Tax=Lapillicoccus sp. TaxID=1909287 RepID=UPI0027C11EA0|nr:DNA repair protein RecO [Actinomycetota bacterium]
MPLYRDEAVVLRTHQLGEADRIITLLTRQHGRIRAVAKGVRRTRSRFGARLEPFMVVDVQCYEGRNLDTVTQAETIAPHGQTICRDYPSYTAATVMVETAERLTEEHEPSTQQYLLLVGALRSLSGAEHDPSLVLDAYLLRSLAVNGWAPSFYDCAKCGAPGPHRAFNIAAGGSVCTVCRPPGSAAPATETMRLLASLLSGDWVLADASDERHRREGSGLVSAFLQWHLERGVRSLRHVERRSHPENRSAAAQSPELLAQEPV